tara:strand:- start:1736 stop:1987 length:252 start_codon:yes stop_codon:yes gene_type:complete
VIYSIRVFLWGIVSELEYQLYPWKTTSPPEWVKSEQKIEENYYQNFNDDWLKAHDDKINRLQSEMIWVQQEIHRLHVHNSTNQ